MRVRIGNQWHEVNDETPIMVELTEQDKANITNMPDDARRYAVFTDNCPLTTAEKVEWVRE